MCTIDSSHFRLRQLHPQLRVAGERVRLAVLQRGRGRRRRRLQLRRPPRQESGGHHARHCGKGAVWEVSLHDKNNLKKASGTQK